MSMVFKKGVRYSSEKKGIKSLMLGGSRNSGRKDDFYVMEVVDSKGSFQECKIVKRGTITECRRYMKDRFYKH